jgi:outer membrane protein OmpA-like peptidoglycan-associated protein
MIRHILRAGLALAFVSAPLAGLAEIAVQQDKVHGARNLSTIQLDGATLFGFNRHVLTPGGKKALDAVLARNVFTPMQRIRVIGHTDQLGTKRANRKLSMARAEAVRKYLMSRNRNLHLEAVGMGDTQPLVHCSTKLSKAERTKCLAPNRRVELDPISD